MSEPPKRENVIKQQYGWTDKNLTDYNDLFIRPHHTMTYYYMEPFIKHCN